MEYYGPRFKLEVLANNSDDHNPPEYLEGIKKAVFESLRNLPHAPSAGMNFAPQPLRKELGMRSLDPDDPDDEIEERVQKIIKSESDDDSEVPNRARKAMEDEEDMMSCGSSRRKRTFFAKKAVFKPEVTINGFNQPPVNGLLKKVINGGAISRDISRAGSPMSVS
jgi:histone deacetylase 1/2